MTSGWAADTEELVAATSAMSGGSSRADERQRLAHGTSGNAKSSVLSAKAVLMIWTLFVLGFVLILCAAIAYSAGFASGGTGCLLGGIGCLVAASVWQWRASGARLQELGRSAAYPHMPGPGAGGACNIQDEAEGPAPGFHF